MDPDEDFVCFGDGLRDVCESQHVWRPVPVVDNCPHRFPFLPSLPFLLAVGCGWRIAPRSVILRPCTRLPDQRQTGRAVSSLVPGWDAPCGLCEDAPSEGRVVRHPAQTTSTRPVGYPGLLASWHPGIPESMARLVSVLEILTPQRGGAQPRGALPRAGRRAPAA